MSRLTLASVGLLLAVCLTESAKLPDHWKRCRKLDPNLNECIRIGIQDAINKLSSPIPELKLQSFEPLEVKKLTIGEGKGPVNVVQNFMNLKLYGVTNGVIESVMIDLEKGALKVTTLSPKIQMLGQYDMKGTVLLLPVNGKGECNITLFNTRIEHDIKLENFEKKGKTYYKIAEYDTRMKPEKIIFKFDNLLGGNKEIEENINKLLNENFSEVFEDVKESYEHTFSIILKDLANQVFTRVPKDDIFLA